MASETLAVSINSRNVGKIAERIVANELEARGFRVSDLNRDGLAPNADLLAAGHGKAWQIQVKGSTNAPTDRWWVGYGYCTDEVIARQQPMFNRHDSDRSFYRADIVVLVAVRSPTDYRCIVMPTTTAEKAAQLNLDRGYRTRTRDGQKKKPGKVWVHLEAPPREHERPPDIRELGQKERAIIGKHLDAWGGLA